MKVNGTLSDFAAVRTEGTQIVISYGLKQVEGDLYEWHEVSLNKTSTNALTLDIVKNAILGDINSQTDAEILCGFDYTIQHGSDQGKQVKVWLSEANQTDIDRLANVSGVLFPVRHKVAEDGAGNAIYEEFQNATEMKSLSDSFTIYIHQCQEAGWQRKDAFDWQAYQDALDALTPTT